MAKRTVNCNMTFSPHFTITNSISSALTKIERARGFLEAAKLSEDWIHDMQDRALVLEAHHTTHIEGTHLTLSQSERLFAGKKVSGADPQDVCELLNYRSAFEFVTRHMESGDPVTEGLIREIHKHLVKGVRGGSAAPGKYRVVQNYVVNSLTGDIIYTPPPANEVPIMMAEMVAWLSKKSEIPAILVAGIAQHQLVNIHPFMDGNGRTARLLSTLCLYRSGYDFKRLFAISEYYDRDRPAYYQAIQDVRENKMDLTGWLEYFTEGLAAQMLEVREQGELVLRTDLILGKGRKAGLNERQVDLLSFLLKQGKGSMAEFEATLKVNRRTLQRDLKLLAEKGFAREVGTSPTDPTRHYEPIL